jgi:hypothetical protein
MRCFVLAPLARGGCEASSAGDYAFDTDGRGRDRARLRHLADSAGPADGGQMAL